MPPHRLGVDSVFCRSLLTITGSAEWSTLSRRRVRYDGYRDDYGRPDVDGVS